MDPWQNISHQTREQIRELQDKKLAQFINEYLYPFSPYYRNLFDGCRIDPRKIRTVEDLKQIPLTAKSDFLASQGKPEKFREFILQPDQKKMFQYWPKERLLALKVNSLWRGKDYAKEYLAREFRPTFMTFTTGTTNSPISFLYTQYDINNLSLSGQRMLALFDVEESGRIVNMFPFAPHLAFWQVVFGGLSAGVLTLSTGGGKVMGTEGNLAAILKMKPSLILGVPGYVYHVMRAAQEKGRDMSFVKKVVLGAARVTEPFKIKLAGMLEAMGARDVSILGTYGFTEARSAWAECPTPVGISSGYHLYPDKEIFEIVDPDSGHTKHEEEDGELVYTALDARGSAVIRYRTGDYVKGGISYAACPHCRRLVGRISSDITRLSDTRDLQLSKIKGSLVNLDHFASCLEEFDSIEEWQVEIRKKDNDPHEIDELVVYAAAKKECNMNQLKDDIKRKIHQATEISPNDIIFLSLEEMVKRLELETASKEKRIKDLRSAA